MRDKAKQATASRTPRRGRLAPALLCLAVMLAAGALAPAAASAVDNIPFQGAFCEPLGLGSAPCLPQFTNPENLAIDPASGDLYVADIGNEVQKVTISATAGQFRLKYGGETSDDIPYDYGNILVKSVLSNSIAALSGSVSVSGGPGDATGSTPYLISFVGKLSGTDVDQLECVAGTTPLSGGSGCSITTVTQGTPTTVSRFHADGTPDPFTALGSNAIDGKLGPEAKPCGEEPASCDKTPTIGGVFGTKTEAKEVQVAIAPPGAAGGTGGDIYVTNVSNHLIDVFAADGHYLGQIAKYRNGSGEEKPLGSPCGVAVDQSGALYVGDSPTSTGGVHKYVPTANPPTAADGVPGFTGATGNCTLAAGAGPTAGFLFGAEFGRGQVAKIDRLSGAQVCFFASHGTAQPPPPQVTTVTVNPANGHVFVVRGNGAAAGNSEVAEYDGSCAPNFETDAPVLSIAHLPSTGQGAAYDPLSAHLFVSRAESANVEIYGEPITLPVATTLAAAPIGETEATLNGTVNPEGTELAECAFDYIAEGEYNANVAAKVDPFTGAASEECAESPAEIGAGEEAVNVHAELSSLEAGVEYHFRLRAKNAGGTDTGADHSFATRAAPGLGAEWVVSVGHTGATLKAQINPHHYATTYRVEYGLDTSYGQSTGEISVGSDNTVHTVTAMLSGLIPGASYRWRFVATNENGESTGPGGALVTYAEPAAESCANAAFRIGAGAGLPDCRAYELVSPVDKGGGDIAAGNAEFRQAALDGNRITYSSATAFGDAQRGAFASQYLATRGAGGWSSHALNPPQGPTVFDASGKNDLVVRASVDLNNNFQAFTPDLCSSLMEDQNQTPLTEDAIHGFTDVYLRDNCGPGADGYEAITRGGPPLSLSADYAPMLWLNARNYTADLSEIVFSSRAALTADAADEHVFPQSTQLYLYDRADQQTHLVSILPGGAGPSTRANVLGTGEPRVRATLARALSQDGSRVFWSAASTEGGSFLGGSLYVRLNPAEEQSALDGEGKCSEAAKACTLEIFDEGETAKARFWTADTAGSKAIYSVGGDLNEFDVDEAIAEEQAGATPAAARAAATSPIAAEAGGVVGSSEDLSHLYFTAKEAIGGSGANERGEEAQAGEWNLYLRQNGAISFIATLAQEDRKAEQASIDELKPEGHSSRVSPDGRHLAFMSIRQLSGYDNTDLTSGEADKEVFIYDASSGELHCASCNPSGARPAGIDAGPHNGEKVTERWTAAWLPRWERSNYASRSLLDDGSRLFFNSYDGLVSADTNHAQDVYQWEALGTGSCSVSDPAYSEQNGGCVSLISTGRSSSKSQFVDASANGSDVFITTQSSIDPRDPGLQDIYDARVGGGYPPPPPPGAACIGDACQSVPAAPNDPTPASAAFHGPGDPGPISKRACPKGRHRVTRAGKTRCAKKARHQKKHKRAHHNRRNAR